MNLVDALDRPELLALLLLAPLAWLFELRLLRVRARRRERALGPRVGALASDLAPRRARTRATLFALGLLLALLALLRPVQGDDVRAVGRRGVDVVLCLDVSRSMLAQDAVPSRLQRARDELAALAAHVGGDRLGLVVFAGDARVLVPLTEDGSSFTALLAEADPLAVTRGGSDLGAALDAARDALLTAVGDTRTIVLLTDGEDLGGRARAAARVCAEQGIVVHCVGFGDVRGSKIALEAAAASEPFLRDRAGRDVVSSLDVDGLRTLAALTGGEFVETREMPEPLVQLYDARILPGADRALVEQGRRERGQRFQWPLLGALLAWTGAFVLPGRRRARRISPAPLGSVALFAVLACAFVTPACERTTDAGRRAYDEGRFDDARDAFGAALPDDGEDGSAVLQFDLALAALRASDLGAADEALERASVARGRAELLPSLEFLRGNLAFARAEQAAAQASGPEAEPFAWDVAVMRAEAARDAWMAAAVTRDDWPEASRNVERAARAVLEYRRAREQAAGNRSLSDERGTKILAVPPESPVGAGPLTEQEAEVEGSLTELSAEQVAGLRTILAEKEREKRALRRTQRAELSADVERDW